MEVGGQYHCLTALNTEKGPSMTIEQEEGCASDLVWTFRNRKQVLVPTEICTKIHRSKMPIPKAWTLKSRIITGEIKATQSSYAGLLSVKE